MNIKFEMSSQAHHSFVGTRFAPRTPVMIPADINAIIAVLSNAGICNSYFCNGHLCPPKFEKYTRVVQWIEENNRVYAPVIDLTSNNVEDFKIVDGTHTFIALKNIFPLSYIKIVVPHDKAQLLADAFR